MTYYRGSRVPLAERETRVPAAGGWRARRAPRAEPKYFLRLFGPGRKKAESRRETPRVYAFYRPGVTPAVEAQPFRREAAASAPARRDRGLATPGFSREKKAWVLKRPALRGMQWAFQWMGLVLLVAAVVWSRSKTTALLQDLAGMRLEKVTVEGNHYLSEAQVLKAVDMQPGENMFKLDLEKADARVKALDWVKGVFIERRLPRSILVSIRERRPVALLDEGALYGVDREGRVLPPSPALLQQNLPLISGVTLRPDAVGTTLEAKDLEPALDFFALLARKDPVMGEDVSEANLSDPDSLQVTFIDGIRAVFDPPVTETDLKRMALVLSDLGEKGKRARSLDFRYRDMVVVKTR